MAQLKKEVIAQLKSITGPDSKQAGGVLAFVEDLPDDRFTQTFQNPEQALGYWARKAETRVKADPADVLAKLDSLEKAVDKGFRQIRQRQHHLFLGQMQLKPIARSSTSRSGSGTSRARGEPASELDPARIAAIQYYYGEAEMKRQQEWCSAHHRAFITSTSSPPAPLLRCAVTGLYFNPLNITAAHLLSVSCHLQQPEFLGSLGIFVDDPVNILLMNARAEEAFDKGRYIIVPDREHYQILLLDHKGLRKEPPFYGWEGQEGEGDKVAKKWDDLHGAHIHGGTTDGRPKLGPLYLHAKLALQRAQALDWLKDWPEGWAYPAMPPVERYMVDDKRIVEWGSRAVSETASSKASSKASPKESPTESPSKASFKDEHSSVHSSVGEGADEVIGLGIAAGEHLEVL